MASLIGSAASTFARNKASNIKESMNDSMSKIDWENYNYPPGLHVIHFDLNDVEDPDAKKALHWCHVSFGMGSLLCFLNIFITIVLAIGGVEDKGVNLVYSIFNAIIYNICAMFAFWSAYKGLVIRANKHINRYMIVQGLVMIFMFMSMLLGTSNFNGFLNISRAQDSKHMSSFWTLWTVAESLAWLADLCISGFAFKLVYEASGVAKTGVNLTNV